MPRSASQASVVRQSSPRVAEVEAGLGVVDREAGRLERGAEPGPAGGVALALDLDVGGVGEHGDHDVLDGPRHQHAEVLADLEQLADQRRVTGQEPGPVAGQVGPLGQREHGEQPVVAAPRHVGVQHGDGSASQPNSP